MCQENSLHSPLCVPAISCTGINRIPYYRLLSLPNPRLKVRKYGDFWEGFLAGCARFVGRTRRLPCYVISCDPSSFLRSGAVMAWGQIASAVAGPLVQGLFGGRSKAQGVDYKKLRRDAEAAGFNPLTALMAGGGAGYQRDFNPALSSGSFIAEAVSRGVDTYFNLSNEEAAQADREAEAVRDHNRRKDLIKFEHELGQTRSGFGFDLSRQVPYTPPQRSGAPAMSPSASQSLSVATDDLEAKRPPMNPLSRPQEFIPVRFNDGSRGRVDKTIARRMDIKPWDTVSAGDWPEIVGELAGEAGNAVAFDRIQKTATGEGPIERYFPENPSPPPMSPPDGLMRNARPKSGWMDDYFGGSFPK